MMETKIARQRAQPCYPQGEPSCCCGNCSPFPAQGFAFPGSQPFSGEGVQPPQPAGTQLNSPQPRAPVHSPLAFTLDMLALGGIIRSSGSDDDICVADTQTCLPIPVDSRDVLSWLITCLSAFKPG